VAGCCGWRVFVDAVSGVWRKVATDRGGYGAACCLCARVGVVSSWKICAAAVAHHDLRDWARASKVGIAQSVLCSRREEETLWRWLLAGRVGLERLSGGVQCFQRHVRSSILVQVALHRVIATAASAPVLACLVAGDGRDRRLLDTAVDRPGYQCTPEEHACAEESKDCSDNDEHCTLRKAGVLHERSIGGIRHDHCRDTSACDCGKIGGSCDNCAR